MHGIDLLTRVVLRRKDGRMDMSTWSFRLPAHGHDLWIVRAAYARDWPDSMAELGRRLTLSRSQASRTVQRLVEEGYLIERSFGYDFNEAHPMAVELGRWLYLTTGARRLDPSRFYPYRQPDSERIGASRVLPDHWRTLNLAPATGEAPTHSALEARQAAAAIAEAGRILPQLEDLAQEVYSDVKAERARDFIHLLGGLRTEASLASWFLRRHAARQNVSRQQSPLEPVVYEVEWERVGFLLDAQVELFESTADHVSRAYTLGRDARRNRENIADEMADYTKYNTATQAGVLERTAQDAREIKELRERALEQNLFWHGGMPGFGEVGTLGDLFVKQGLLRARDNLREVQQRHAFPSKATPVNHARTTDLP